MSSFALGSASFPRVILGTSSIGHVAPDALVSATERERTFRYLDAMLEVGCTAFDIAASYQLGGTERIIGHWLASRRNRDRLYLITKGGHPYPVVQPRRVTPKALRADLDDSLRRLQTDHIDLYLLHRDDPGSELEPILETMVSFQETGHVRAWGVSNWTSDRIEDLNTLARKSFLPPVAASSPHFSLAEWARVPWKGCVSIAGEANREERAFYANEQVPVLAWSPLGHGFFGANGASGANAERTKDDPTYALPANVARRERAEKLAQKYEVTSANIALAYLFSQAFPVFAIVAARTAEKMKNNLAATTLRLPKAEVRWLESGDAALGESGSVRPPPA